MRRRILGGVLCALLLLGVVDTAVLASDEQAEAPEESVVSEGPEAALTEESTEPALCGIPVEESLPEEPDGEDETILEEVEPPVPEYGGESILVPEELAGMDPEDPLYSRAMLQLDGAYGSTYSAFVTRALDNEELRYGIDVSAWQSTINWTKVAQSGVQFAFLRGAYRTVGTGKINQDGRFLEYIRGAKAAGIQVGVYIFSQAITVKEALEEADYLLNLVRGYDIDLPLVFDLEHYPGGRFSNAGLSRRAVTDMCLAFCERVSAAGYVPMVYSNPSMLNNDMYPSEIGRLWLANYTTKTSYTGHKYEYWQCSDHGDIAGIDGYVDLDFWFMPKGTEASSDTPFSDVKRTDWFYEPVMACYEAGVIKGVTKTTFRPSMTATRGQVVTMLYRLAGEPGWTTKAAFTDLVQDYYKDAIYWAAENGIVEGYTGGIFCPDKSITREELVTILHRLAGAPDADTDLAEYSDSDEVRSWSQQAMCWAVETELVSGYEDGTLRPRVDANRAVVCTILSRLEGLV